MNLKTPKVNDRVRVVSSTNMFAGQEGVVTYAYPPSYRVSFGGSDLCFYDGELEVIEQEVNGL